MDDEKKTSNDKIKERSLEMVRTTIKDDYPEDLIEIKLVKDTIEHDNHLGIDLRTFEFKVIELHELTIHINAEKKCLVYYSDKFENIQKGDYDYSPEAIQEYVISVFELPIEDKAVDIKNKEIEMDNGITTINITVSFASKKREDTEELFVRINKSTGKIIELTNSNPNFLYKSEPDNELIKNYIEKCTRIYSNYEEIEEDIEIQDTEKKSGKNKEIDEYHVLLKISTPFIIDFLGETHELTSWYFSKREFGGKEDRLPYEEVENIILKNISLPKDAYSYGISGSDFESGKSPAYIGYWYHVTPDGWKVDVDQLRVSINAFSKKIYSYIKFWTDI